MAAKLQELTKSYAHRKRVAVIGEDLSLQVLAIMNQIDKVLADFQKVVTDPVLMEELTAAAGGSHLEYSQAIAMILTEAKMKVEALG